MRGPRIKCSVSKRVNLLFERTRVRLWDGQRRLKAVPTASTKTSGFSGPRLQINHSETQTYELNAHLVKICTRGEGRIEGASSREISFLYFPISTRNTYGPYVAQNRLILSRSEHTYSSDGGKIKLLAMLLLFEVALIHCWLLPQKIPAIASSFGLRTLETSEDREQIYSITHSSLLVMSSRGCHI